MIDHNVARHNIRPSSYSNYYTFHLVSNSQIKNNILVDPGSNVHSGDNCAVSNNMLLNRTWGDNSVSITSWDEVFEGAITAGVNVSVNYHLKEDAQGKNAGTDGTDIGIYGGTGFSDKALPPGPRIISKKVAEQTDADGNLQVEIQVSTE